MVKDTQPVIFNGYSLQVSKNENGYYASLIHINDVHGCDSLYIRNDGTITRSMGLSDGKFGYCETLVQIKNIVQSLFPYHYYKIDFSALEVKYAQ